MDLPGEFCCYSMTATNTCEALVLANGSFRADSLPMAFFKLVMLKQKLLTLKLLASCAIPCDALIA